jgi:hypothetical protein
MDGRRGPSTSWHLFGCSCTCCGRQASNSGLAGAWTKESGRVRAAHSSLGRDRRRVGAINIPMDFQTPARFYCKTINLLMMCCYFFLHMETYDLMCILLGLLYNLRNRKYTCKLNHRPWSLLLYLAAFV